MGAYSHTMKTNFNGFLSQSKVFYVDEKPITDTDFFLKNGIKKELVWILNTRIKILKTFIKYVINTEG